MLRQDVFIVEEYGSRPYVGHQSSRFGDVIFTEDLIIELKSLLIYNDEDLRKELIEFIESIENGTI